MNYIFFDIDGVLNGTDENGNLIDTDIDENKVNNLVAIAKECNAKLICISSWNHNWDENGNLIERANENAIILNKILNSLNCPLYSITPRFDHKRAFEIKMWLRKNASKNDNFICIDDEKNYYKNDEFFNNKLIHTGPETEGWYKDSDIVGLFKHHVEEAINILNNKKENNKMKKLFISQPMKGKTDKEILAERSKAIDKAKEHLGEDVEVIDSFFEGAPHNAKPLWFLSKSLEKLSEADIAYFVSGWDKARGCKIEHTCAVEYGIETIYE